MSVVNGGMFGGNVWGNVRGERPRECSDHMQDYESVCVAVMICATLSLRSSRAC